MDYCHPCGRHLNGALACAGCGTPVEELRRHATTAPAAQHVYELDVEPEPARPGPRASRRQAQTRRKPASSGRRGRKRRGRKVVIGTFGLVLAAGALSLAELATEGSGGDGAATSVKERAVAETESIEPSASQEAPDGPEEVRESAVTSSGSPGPAKSASGTGKATAGGGDGKGEGGAKASEPSASASDGGGASPSATGDPDDPEPSTSGEPQAGSDGPPPPPQPAPPPPEPTPTPTCDRFLWWCI